MLKNQRMCRSLGGASVQQQAVEMLRTNVGLMNNYYKTEKQQWITQEMAQNI